MKCLLSLNGISLLDFKIMIAIAKQLRTGCELLKSFLARCQALSADLTGDRIKNAAAGAAIV